MFLPQMALHIKRVSKYFLLVSVSVFISCHKQQFKWKTRSLNTQEFIESRDSILHIEGVAKDITYGYSLDNPVCLGVKDFALSLAYPEKYFNSLTGPNGELIVFNRIKSCCPFKTVNSKNPRFQNLAVLEMYSISYKGIKSPAIVYVNFFDQGNVLAPKGFLYKRFDNLSNQPR